MVNKFDYKGKEMSRCADCGFVILIKGKVGDTCTFKHLDGMMGGLK